MNTHHPTESEPPFGRGTPEWANAASVGPLAVAVELPVVTEARLEEVVAAEAAVEAMALAVGAGAGAWPVVAVDVVDVADVS